MTSKTKITTKINIATFEEFVQKKKSKGAKIKILANNDYHENIELSVADCNCNCYQPKLTKSLKAIFFNN